MKQIRHLHLVGATGQIRTAEFNKAQHIVVPVVAMVEGVVWAVNSEYPEFVAAEELALSPQQWNGRPAFADHPEDGGTQVTANTPRTLEQSFGVVFNTASAERILQTRKLEFEVWLDPVKAAVVSPRAAAVCDRLLAGEVVEVSVGSYVISHKEEGDFHGKRYLARWTDIVSDHVAFLEEGAEGACSVAAGCGAPRTAVRHLISAEGIRREDVVEPKKVTAPPKKHGLKERFMSYLAGQGLISAQSLSDQDVRYAIDAALRAVEPGYMGIDSVFPDEGKVVYYVSPADEWKTFRRGYTITAGNDVATLLDDVEEVEAVTTYEPVITAAAAAQTRAACGCGGQHPATPQEGARIMLTKEARAAAVAALIAFETNPLKDAKAYDGLEEATLESLAAHYKAAATTPPSTPSTGPTSTPSGTPSTPSTPSTPTAPSTPSTPSTPKSAEAVTQTEDEFLAAHPAIKGIVDEHKAREEAEKNALVASLSAASSVLSAEELKKKTLGDLKTLAAFAKINVAPAVDFSGQGAPRALATSAEDFTPPNPYTKGIKALQGSKAVN